VKSVTRDYLAGRLRNAAPVIESRALFSVKVGSVRPVIRVSRKWRVRVIRARGRDGKAIDVVDFLGKRRVDYRRVNHDRGKIAVSRRLSSLPSSAVETLIRPVEPNASAGTIRR
jgi:hypothetical protein